jgi:hypothetical protein
LAASHRKDSFTHSFCIALTTALENGAEVTVSALILCMKALLNVGTNMQLQCSTPCQMHTTKNSPPNTRYPNPAWLSTPHVIPSIFGIFILSDP